MVADSLPHIQPLTSISEVSEPPESLSPFLDVSAVDAEPIEMENEIDALRLLFGGLAVAGGGDGGDGGGGGGSRELCCSVVVVGGLAMAGSGFVVMTVAGRYVKLVYCFVCGGRGRI
ncbi:unnamed protein product [Fraxinus pennsylvanica]|uniref:Uncharacterized protein n=1 Tax=Fraxinus pennsylvanica TaxID=56036 RepID=A0AAD2DNR6_9LAMI|nr:unnamed protein product [Fraxinus pennsylvanica]